MIWTWCKHFQPTAVNIEPYLTFQFVRNVHTLHMKLSAYEYHIGRRGPHIGPNLEKSKPQVIDEGQPAGVPSSIWCDCDIRIHHMKLWNWYDCMAVYTNTTPDTPECEKHASLLPSICDLVLWLAPVCVPVGYSYTPDCMDVKIRMQQSVAENTHRNKALLLNSTTGSPRFLSG
jgi:hypothetical protein